MSGDRLLARIEPGGQVVFPCFAATDGCLPPGEAPLHIGVLEQCACWLLDCAAPDAPAPGGWEWMEIRPLLAALHPAQWQALASARQLQWWNRRHRYCGCCGARTVEDTTERMRRCPGCGAAFFPSAAPAVIVAVTRGERLLLAHNRNFRSGMFSLLAGFVDPGETLEQAVQREVREEVGIEIGRLQYVTSQPWPFPNSLMLGFRTEHLAGEISVDGHEIQEAGWFARDALPSIPAPGTVSRELIDAWLGERCARPSGAP